jgi:hypothetical protein
VFAIMMHRFLQHLVREGYPKTWASHTLSIALGCYRSMATLPRTVDNLWWWCHEAGAHSNWLWFGHEEDGLGCTLAQRSALKAHVRTWFPYQYTGN